VRFPVASDRQRRSNRWSTDRTRNWAFYMSGQSTDRTTDRATAGSWMTYAEAAERFGTSTEAIRLRSRRLHWRTQRANDGKTLVWIADDAAVRPRVRPPDRPYVQPPDQPPGHISEISQLTALLTAQHERADRAEQRADEANKRADVATALADKALAQAAEAEKRVEQAESRLNQAQDRLNRADRLEMEQDKLESELEAGKIGLSEALADAAELRQQIEQARAGSRLRRAWRAWRGE
jgi:DNA repair exonuclease SbcCD ATPase subunit